MIFGLPPAEVAAPIDIRGDVRGRSLGEWHASSGRLYARLDYADVAAWRVWLPLPIDLRSGKGALRVWLEYAGGEPREIVADLVLTDVETRLAPELRELALARLEGRIGWRSQPGTREFFTKRLTFAGAGGARFDPTDFKLTLHPPNERHPTSRCHLAYRDGESFDAARTGAHPTLVAEDLPEEFAKAKGDGYGRFDDVWSPLEIAPGPVMPFRIGMPDSELRALRPEVLDGREIRWLAAPGGGHSVESRVHDRGEQSRRGRRAGRGEHGEQAASAA